MPRTTRRFPVLLLPLAVGACFVLEVMGASLDPAGLEHFEKHIRPLLISECIDCHGPDKQKGGLRLDSRDAILLGGDTGMVLKPGSPEESLLVEVIAYSGDLKMPPKKRLPESMVEQVRKWIEMGAPDPREADATLVVRKGIDIEKGREHWSYQPVSKPPIPSVRTTTWPRSEIDFFILSQLEREGLSPAGDADPETWIRRLHYSLTGLPPSPAEIDAFVLDGSEDARERAVNRLLDSPRFGERWGRHWLDVARYGESVTLRGLVFQNAWRYRDYVIEAFNRDLPYDQFVREQVSGDLLPAKDHVDRGRKLVATSFFTIGNHGFEEQNKEALNMNVVDEQLDTLGKAFLGQTLGCARCHDHKFDPIPTRDYYALAGILRSSNYLRHENVSTWVDIPMPLSPEQEKARKDHEAAIKSLKKEMAALRKITGTLSQKKDGKIKASSLPGLVIDDAEALKVGDWVQSTFKNTFIGEGYLHDGNTDKGAKSLTFEPDIKEAGRYEVLFAFLGHSNRSSKTPVTIQSAEGEKTIKVNQRKLAPIDGRFLSLGTYTFETNGFSTVLISNEGTDGVVVADAIIFVPVAPGASRVAGDAGDEDYSKARERLTRLENELNDLEKQAPEVPMAMAMQDREDPADIRIHIRGTVNSLGEEAPRGFLQVASLGEVPVVPEDGSGRVELGRWLTDEANPLTARVYANRVWHWLMGSGIVRSTDNFGTTGTPPTHPELLDYLATRLKENNWSTKGLIREIVLSRTWGLASDPTEQQQAKDPRNLLLGHANRTRLEAEMIRDALLKISGQLELSMGGSELGEKLKADYGFSYEGNRRSIYVPQLRNSPIEILETFDMANSSFTTGNRDASTVAPQALYLLNHPFVIQQAEHAAKKLLAGDVTEDEKLDQAWRSTLGRYPTRKEKALMKGFLEQHAASPEASSLAWAQVYQSLFGSIDFRYIP